jgi:hypothetical protein
MVRAPVAAPPCPTGSTGKFDTGLDNFYMAPETVPGARAA